MERRGFHRGAWRTAAEDAEAGNDAITSNDANILDFTFKGEVVASADATPGQIARLRDAGADDYLTKPLDIPRFAEVVRKRLE